MAEKTRTSELAAVIRAIRARSGQNQTDFGRTLGVTHATQSRYESGLVTPGHYPLLTLFKLAEGHEKRGDSRDLERLYPYVPHRRKASRAKSSFG